MGIVKFVCFFLSRIYIPEILRTKTIKLRGAIISVFELLFQGGRSPTIPYRLLEEVPLLSKGSWLQMCLYLVF